MSVAAPNVFVLGSVATLEADLTDLTGALEDASALSWFVRDPAGVEHNMSSGVVRDSLGKYHLDVEADAVGVWWWRIVTTGFVVAANGQFTVEDEFGIVTDPTSPTDLRVLVPRARRYCEGPFPDPQKPRLSERQVYEMVADACGDIILLSGDLFGRKLIVTSRDARVGFPVTWATDRVLDEWEGALITTQAALNFFFHEFKDKKVSEGLANEGQTWNWALSPLVLRQQFEMLKDARDRGIAALKEFHPTLARFASVLAVRDRQTASILEWWSRANPGQVGEAGGLGGGQEAAVVPVFWPPGP